MSSPRPRFVQLFGERCSGTNFVAELVRRNVPGLRLTDRYGWKHGWSHRVDGAAEDCVFLVVHRDPFDWVRSLCRSPWHVAPPLRDVPLDRFVRMTWWCEWGADAELTADDLRLGTEMMHERDPATGERFANCLRLRTAKLRDWARLTGRVRHFVAVRYEDVAREPRAFVRGLARRFGHWRWPWFRAVRTFKGGPERFVPVRYEPIPAADRAWIVSQLDLEVERAAGYDPSASGAVVPAAGFVMAKCR